MIIDGFVQKNVIIDIIFKKVHLYDKIINNLDIFFREIFYISTIFLKKQNKKSLLETNKMVR